LPEHPDIDESIGPNLLLDAFSLTSGDRNEMYGPFLDDYARATALFNIITGGEPVEMSPVLMLLAMRCVKLSRQGHKIQTGMAEADPTCLKDDVTDDMGYGQGFYVVAQDPMGWVAPCMNIDELDLDDGDDDDDEGGDGEPPEPLPLPDGGDAEKVDEVPPVLTAETEPIHEPDDTDQDVDITSNQAPPAVC
jgi:hypothetical protein